MNVTSDNAELKDFVHNEVLEVKREIVDVSSST